MLIITLKILITFSHMTISFPRSLQFQEGYQKATVNSALNSGILASIMHKDPCMLTAGELH